jgi:DNA-binding response OmpR family regulator
VKRVLLVDDDADILDSLALVLSDTYDIAVAGNGARALDLLLQSPFDAVVLDLMMPVLDGAGLMRELDARGMRVPIILASASIDLDQQRQLLGAAASVAKPFPLTELEDKLARVLGAGGGGGGAPGPGGFGGVLPEGGGGTGGTQAHA